MNDPVYSCPHVNELVKLDKLPSPAYVSIHRNKSVSLKYGSPSSTSTTGERHYQAEVHSYICIIDDFVETGTKSIINISHMYYFINIGFQC